MTAQLSSMEYWLNEPKLKLNCEIRQTGYLYETTITIHLPDIPTVSLPPFRMSQARIENIMKEYADNTLIYQNLKVIHENGLSYLYLKYQNEKQKNLESSIK